jgi:hypothetical protein
MAMLDRYRKTGGFNQLLNLLETCGPSKQEKFLELIRAEDPKWADMILTKMLDINRIYSWNQETLAEIIGALQDLTIVVLLHGASDQIRARINSCFTQSQQRKIDALYSEHSPTPLDVTAAQVKVIETVRRMVQTGSLRFDKFDAGLIIEDGIEDTIAKTYSPETTTTSTNIYGNEKRHLSVVKPMQGTEKPEAGKQEPGKGTSVADCRMDEINALKQRLGDLSKENAALRHELSLIKSKLDQIKRIA